MFHFIGIDDADDKVHKYVATFLSDEGKIKNVKFGAFGYNDYISYYKDLGKTEADIKKANYIHRHGAREDWTEPTSRGTLALYILWNKPTLESSIKDYRNTFYKKNSRFVF